MRLKLLATLMAVGMGVGVGHQAAQAAVTQEMLDNAATDTKEVLTWGMGTEGQRFSPLKQVNTETVKRLVPAWSFSSRPSGIRVLNTA